MKILVGTANPGKARELVELLAGTGIEVVSLRDVGLSAIEETGTTFEENALLKARTYAAASGLPCLADDGGLEIDALDGAPGVYSHRWAGEQASDFDLAEKVIVSLADVPADGRSARLRTVLAFTMPDGESLTVDRSIAGRIAMSYDRAKIQSGYPYRSLLIVDRYGKLFADLTHEEHEAVNHRRAALREILPTVIEMLKV